MSGDRKLALFSFFFLILVLVALVYIFFFDPCPIFSGKNSILYSIFMGLMGIAVLFFSFGFLITAIFLWGRNETGRSSEMKINRRLFLG
ncbi:MAG: hypothetical protein UV67_C0001G0003 [Parcubacteria group bacterium GW2011_GWC1_43_12]|nr:MAG: hypothetical protein UV67_C0001G0003 [Parcubacteria group bacterium GW2011_GWC1_43_12]